MQLQANDPSTWPAFWQTLPDVNPQTAKEVPQILRREEAFLKRIEQGDFDQLEWADLLIEDTRGNWVQFSVACDALKMDGIRIPVTAQGATRINASLDCAPPTPKLIDKVWQEADGKLPPCTGLFGPNMSNNTTCLKYNMMVEAEIAKALPKLKEATDPDDADIPYLFATVGKEWVVTKELFIKLAQMGCNYGWHKLGGGIWQTPGYHHHSMYTDYSQIYRPISNLCIVNGFERKMVELYQDKDLAHLVTYDGPLPKVQLWN